MTNATRNTPLEVIIVLATTTLLSISISSPLMPEETLIQVVLTATLLLCVTFGISACAALEVFDERTRWILTAAFGAAILGYGAFVLDVSVETELWRYGLGMTGALMGISLVPVAARFGDLSVGERFWRYNLRLIFRVAVVGVYVISLCVGFAIAFLAVEELLGLSISSEVAEQLFCWTGLGLGGVLAVSGLSDASRLDRELDESTVEWFGRLGTWLFVPLVLLYLGIMYAYLARLVVTPNAPSNFLSPMVLGAGLLGYVGMFALHPFRHRSDHGLLSLVLRAFPAAFIPLVGLGMWAVWERVAQYGWTESRYARMAALVCLGLFGLASLVQWLRRRDFSVAAAPMIVGCVAMLAAVGPWSASHVSKVSQSSRLEHALEAAELLTSERMLVRPETVYETMPTLSEARQTMIVETLRYLLEAHGDEALAQFTRQDVSDSWWVTDKMARLGF